MSRRDFLGSLGLVAIGGALALAARDIFLERDADRRFALYNIMRELRRGMARAEVESIISRHDAPYIMKQMHDESLILSVKLGGMSMLYLSLEFEDEKLIKANFAGEDNPWDVPKDAPQTLNN